MAERVGFEPTWELPPNPLSRRARYDHFGTSPQNALTKNQPRTIDAQASWPEPELSGRRSSVFRLIISGNLARRDAFYQGDLVRRMLKGLHLGELAEQPTLESFPSAL